MDQKALASPELRTQHILSLHQELLESKIQIATLEQALVRVGRLDIERSHNEGTLICMCALLCFFAFFCLVLQPHFSYELAFRHFHLILIQGQTMTMYLTAYRRIYEQNKRSKHYE